MTTRTVRFNKRGQHYIFRYRNDMQDELISHITTLAESREHDLDWLDAATLSFQIAQQAATGDSDVVKPPVPHK